MERQEQHALVNVMRTKGFSLEQALDVIGILEDFNMVSAHKEYGIKNLNTGSIEPLQSTTLDYVLPLYERETVVRLTYQSPWKTVIHQPVS